MADAEIADDSQTTGVALEPSVAITLLADDARNSRLSRDVLAAAVPQVSWWGLAPGMRDLSGARELTPQASVLLHDARHPFVTPAQIRQLLRAGLPRIRSGEVSAVLGVVEVTDTLKRVDEQGRVVATIDRATRRAFVGAMVTRWSILHPLLEAGEPERVLLAHDERFGIPGQVDLTAGAGTPGANAATRVTAQDPSSVDYADAVLASSAAATATSSG